jgi:hypothetical protein
MIAKIERDTKIEPGQWVCFSSMMLGGICSSPRRVTRVAGQRLYVMDKHEEKESFKSIQSAVFVCSTKKEGDELTAISQQIVKDRFNRINELEADIKAKGEAAVAVLVATSNGGAK